MTIKANGNNLDVFSIDDSGVPSDSPVVASLPGTVPFGFVPNDRRGIFLTEAAPSPDDHRHPPRRDGTADGLRRDRPVGHLLGGRRRRPAYTSTAGSNIVSGFRAWDRGRPLTALGHASTDPGTIDAGPRPTGASSTSGPQSTASSTSSPSTPTAL